MISNCTTKNYSIPLGPETVEILWEYLYGIVIPAVCVFGFIGNILNVIIFTKKTNTRILHDMEKCTTICLVALALSDLMFCVCTFPNAFVPTRKLFHADEFILYYKMYSKSLISTFILSSTLLTVLAAIMRYIAICHPFYSQQCISVKSTIISIVVVVFLSIGFNVPALWRFQMAECVDLEDFVYIATGDLYKNEKFVYTHKLLWAILGNFIPLAILLHCNICLIKALRESTKLRLLHSRDDTRCLSTHRRINVTLVAIIIMFFILVAPSEITKFIFYVSNNSISDKETFQIVSMVTNVLQSINFSVNFIMYYVIIAPFRQALHKLFCLLSWRRQNNTREYSDSSESRGDSVKQQTLMLLSIKQR